MPTLSRTNKAFDLRIQKLTKQITIADLTDEDQQQQIDFDSALPTNAMVVAARVKVTTAMSGGTVDGCTVDLGIKSGDTDCFLDGANVFTGAASASTPRGVGIPGFYGGATPTVVVDCTTGNLDDLTAGDITLELYYFDLSKVG